MFQSTTFQRIAFLAVLAASTAGPTSAFTPVPFAVSGQEVGSTPPSSFRLFVGDKTASAADFVEVRDLSGGADDADGGEPATTKIVEDKTASAADFVEVRDLSESGHGDSDTPTKIVEDKAASAADFVEVRDLSDKSGA